MCSQRRDNSRRLSSHHSFVPHLFSFSLVTRFQPFLRLRLSPASIPSTLYSLLRGSTLTVNVTVVAPIGNYWRSNKQLKIEQRTFAWAAGAHVSSAVYSAEKKRYQLLPALQLNNERRKTAAVYCAAQCRSRQTSERLQPIATNVQHIKAYTCSYWKEYNKQVFHPFLSLSWRIQLNVCTLELVECFTCFWVVFGTF